MLLSIFCFVSKTVGVTTPPISSCCQNQALGLDSGVGVGNGTAWLRVVGKANLSLVISSDPFSSLHSASSFHAIHLALDA